MTGISGWYNIDADATLATSFATKMAERLPAPGDQRCFTGTRCGLGCRLENAFVCVESEAGLFAAIEGRPRWQSPGLREIAEAHGHGTALISAYKAGSDFMEDLEGSFALAVIDERADRVLLAIDRMGIRSMSFAVAPDGGVIFGSTADAILAHGQIERTLSPQSIYDYMYFHVVPSPSSVFLKISKLEPGQLIELEPHSTKLRYYWSPAFSRHTNVDERTLEDQALQCMRKSLIASNVDSGTGAFLSGGLDSSTVCGLANELTSTPLPVYSIGFEQDGYDEIAFARIAADYFGLDLREYYVTPDDVAEAIPIIASVYDEPFGNSSAVPAYFCARNAKRDGIDHLLAGDGGDEIFAGNERYATQRLFNYYDRIPSTIRNRIIEPTTFFLPMEWSKWTHKIRRYVEQAQIRMPERLQTYNYLHMHNPATVFEAGFLETVNTDIPVSAMESWYARGKDFDLVDNMLMFDWKLTLADNDIRKVNRMCETAGVRVSYPLLDDELVEFSTQLPAKLKLKGRKLRYFFKNSVKNFLPQQIIDKQKHGFGLPFGEWLRTSTSLRDVVDPSLRRLGQRGIFRKDFIASLIHDHQNVHAAYYGNILWVLVMLDNWLEEHQ